MINVPCRQRRIALALFSALALALPAAGQDMAPARPEQVGMSSQRLARLGQALQEHIDRGELSGAVTLVVRRDRVVQFEARGIVDGGVDGEPAKPMQRDTIFGVASMSKPLTSTAILVLYEDGRLLLDDPISKFIPAFKSPRVYAPDLKPVKGNKRAKKGE